ncbi:MULTISPECIES: branched-chain amino acid ABC transporter substrate-binding protein [unclassified Variovorax]|uniref:branched-chain amino acid ABC transporter substrate-binding protein n=1 Tax=unclassified Variovorax TaxID=663243 RepID=UPI001BD4748A|nr:MULTISPECIES: branched-chain amino acid ABC transporter substrate-binding protein [unclassified Variovorax]
MKSSRFILLASLATTCAATAWAQQPVQAVTIGYVGPTSGSMAHYGVDARNAITLAIDDLNQQALVIDGKRIEFKLAAEDDAGDPKQGTIAAQKLCDAKVSGVVGHINSGSAIPAARIYNECGIPLISPGATNPQFTKPGYKNVFRLVANDNALATGLARYAAEQLKVKRVVVIDDRSAYGQGVSEVFEREARAAHIQIISHEFTTDKASDFQSILTSIKAKNAPAIFFGGNDAQAGPMLRQMEQLGMSDVRLMGGDGICTTQLGKLAQNAKPLANVLCAEGGLAVEKMNNGKAWKARYDQRFPKEYVLFAPYAYDGVMVMADAMKRANSTDPAKYTAELANTNYRGLSTRVQFDSKGDLKNPQFTLYNYQDGVKTPLYD